MYTYMYQWLLGPPNQRIWWSSRSVCTQSVYNVYTTDSCACLPVMKTPEHYVEAPLKSPHSVPRALLASILAQWQDFFVAARANPEGPMQSGRLEISREASANGRPASRKKFIECRKDIELTSCHNVTPWRHITSYDMTKWICTCQPI